MAIDLSFGGNGYYDLCDHIGHEIVIVEYANANTSVECETCGVVLVDFDQPIYDRNGDCLECGSPTFEDKNGEVSCSNETCENAAIDWGTIGEPT